LEDILKSKNYIFHIKILALITLLIVLVIHKAAADEEPVTVAVTPFTLNAPEDMQYLQSGIQAMLESRLSQDQNVMVISDEKVTQAMQGIQEPIDENEARVIGQRLSADYVIKGSLTVFGSSASLDARLVDVTGAQPTRSFSQQSQKIDDLVPKINTLAADMGTIIVSAPAVAAQTAPSAPTPEPVDDTREHPEKITEDIAEPQTSAPALAAGALAAGPSDEFWKSRRFKILMNGIALGDVDGDGKTETVLITPDKVMIYRVENGKIFKIDEFEPGGFRILIGVDVADINTNGKAEIFVTAMNTQRNRIYSDVFEYDGRTFNRIVKDSSWKYRVVEAPLGNPVLLGQKHKDKKPFSGPVFQLQWRAGEYQPEDQVGPGTGCNLMGFVYGDATNQGDNSVVAYDAWDKMRLISADGEELWKHSEKTGGSTLNFSLGIIGQDGQEDIQYLPMRILITDTDKDGQNEVIAVKNYDVVKGALTYFRNFKNAEIHAFTWDGVGLVPKWNTRKISGYMRDFVIGDYDNDGRDEIAVALVLKEGRIAGTTPRSIVIAYQF
jgi:TolB-like protein